MKTKTSNSLRSGCFSNMSVKIIISIDTTIDCYNLDAYVDNKLVYI